MRGVNHFGWPTIKLHNLQQQRLELLEGLLHHSMGAFTLLVDGGQVEPMESVRLGSSGPNPPGSLRRSTQIGQELPRPSEALRLASRLVLERQHAEALGEHLPEI